jgi:large subunit ribosomal protein L32
MAVQKSKKSHSKIGMRRSHDALENPTVSTNDLGKKHLRHCVSPEGYYRGRQVIDTRKTEKDDE